MAPDFLQKAQHLIFTISQTVRKEYHLHKYFKAYYIITVNSIQQEGRKVVHLQNKTYKTNTKTLTNTCVILVMDLCTSNYVNGAGMTLGGSWSDYLELN